MTQGSAGIRKDSRIKRGLLVIPTYAPVDGSTDAKKTGFHVKFTSAVCRSNHFDIAVVACAFLGQRGKHNASKT